MTVEEAIERLTTFLDHRANDELVIYIRDDKQLSGYRKVNIARFFGADEWNPNTLFIVPEEPLRKDEE